MHTCYLEQLFKNMLKDYEKTISKFTSQNENNVIFELDLTKKKLATNSEKLVSIEKDLKNKLH